MPTVFTYKKYRFFFFSNEGSPLEPVHIHIRKGNCLAKFWVEPEIRLVQSNGFSGIELTFLEKVIIKNKNLIIEAWNDFFCC